VWQCKDAELQCYCMVRGPLGLRLARWLLAWLVAIGLGQLLGGLGLNTLSDFLIRFRPIYRLPPQTF